MASLKDGNKEQLRLNAQARALAARNRRECRITEVVGRVFRQRSNGKLIVAEKVQ